MELESVLQMQVKSLDINPNPESSIDLDKRMLTFGGFLVLKPFTGPPRMTRSCSWVMDHIREVKTSPERVSSLHRVESVGPEYSYNG